MAENATTTNSLPDTIDAKALPIDIAVTAIAMAELAAGPHATANLAERARRQDLLIAAIACSEQLPLCTRNPDGFKALGDLVAVHPV